MDEDRLLSVIEPVKIRIWLRRLDEEDESIKELVDLIKSFSIVNLAELSPLLGTVSPTSLST